MDPEQPVIDMIHEVRYLKRLNGISDSSYITVVVEAQSLEEAQMLYRHKKFIEHTTKCHMFFPYTAEEYERMGKTDVSD